MNSTHHCVQCVGICPAGRGPSSSGGRLAGPRAWGRLNRERIWGSSCLGKCRQSLVVCRRSGWRSCRSQCRSPNGHHLGGSLDLLPHSMFLNSMVIVRAKKKASHTPQCTFTVNLTSILWVRVALLYVYGSWSQDTVSVTVEVNSPLTSKLQTLCFEEIWLSLFDFDYFKLKVDLGTVHHLDKLNAGRHKA